MNITAHRLARLLKAEYQAGYDAGYKAAMNTTAEAPKEAGNKDPNSGLLQKLTESDLERLLHEAREAGRREGEQGAQT